MIGLAGKFAPAPASDRRLLVRTLALHACVATLLRLVRFGRVTRWLGARALSRASVLSLELAATERIVWAVRQATALAPWAGPG